MREIRFRAWDNVHGSLGDKMVYHGDGCNLINLSYFWQWVAQHEPMPIMQFTGLCDKNGVEIYEGDVVKNWQGGWNVVVYKAPSFEATVSKDQSSSYSQEWWSSVEVIGNCYEHPELLEAK